MSDKVEFTPEQKAIADQLKFTMLCHFNMANGGELQHTAKYLDMTIYRTVWTPKTKGGQWGKGELTFYIDKEKTEYKTVHALLDELVERTHLRMYEPHIKISK